MLHYTAVQWLFFFYFYCFFGWIFESTFVSVKKTVKIKEKQPLYSGILTHETSLPYLFTQS